MKFAANLSLLFSDLPFLDRFAAAADAGFGAVEFWWPPADALERIPDAVAAAGVAVALFNFDAGDMPAGDRGLLSDPGRVDAFRANVPVALELAGELSCPRINALVGVELEGVSRDDQRELAVESVRYAADEAASAGVTIMIEAVNTFENGPYLLSRTAEAADFVAAVDRPNVELQYDAYHMQRMEGNLLDTIERYLGLIGHIQIADSPTRGEPGTGEINYRFLLRAIDELGYDGYVGLEYKPSGGPAATAAGLGWIGELGYELPGTRRRKERA